MEYFKPNLLIWASACIPVKFLTCLFVPLGVEIQNFSLGLGFFVSKKFFVCNVLRIRSPRHPLQKKNFLYQSNLLKTWNLFKKQGLRWRIREFIWRMLCFYLKNQVFQATIYSFYTFLECTKVYFYPNPTSTKQKLFHIKSYLTKTTVYCLFMFSFHSLILCLCSP